MASHFLGKPLTRRREFGAPKPRFKPWLGLFSLPLLFAIGLTALQPNTFQGSLRRNGVREVVTIPSSNRFFAAAAPVTPIQPTSGAPADKPNPCDSAAVRTAMLGNIFPIVHPLLRNFKAYSDNPTTGCVPALWTRNVLILFIYKALALLNYLAGALAILSFIYAGILYMSSFASEGMLKTAKGAVVGTCIGLAIVTSARFIVGGSFQLFGNVNDAKDLSNLIPK